MSPVCRTVADIVVHDHQIDAAVTASLGVSVVAEVILVYFLCIVMIAYCVAYRGVFSLYCDDCIKYNVLWHIFCGLFLKRKL